MNLVICLALLPFFLSQSDAEHFRGATIQWSPVYSIDGNFTGFVSITHQISWVRDTFEGGRCDREVIQSQQLLGGGFGLLTCRAGCTGVIGTMDYFCTDFSEVSNWSTGRRSYEYDTNGIEVFEASFASGNWEILVIGGGTWELRVMFNLTERQDTGRVNTSPSSIFFPNLQQQHGCNHTIQISAFDVDGDVIRCRWAVGNECAGVCNALPGELNPETCTIEFSATGSEGSYAVAIQVEDFANSASTEPLSSVPIQFIVEVIDLGLSCTDRVDFVGDTPAHGSCFGVGVNQTIHGRITARDTEGHNITGIQTVSPPGLRKSILMTDEEQRDWYVDYYWTPDFSVTGPQLFCFTARASAGASSLERCITLIARASTPMIIENTLHPRGLINQSDIIDWGVEFDSMFVRPSSSEFIRVFAENGEEIAAIDVSLSDVVFYPDPEDTPVLRFLTNFTAQEGSTYYVLFDSGIAVFNDTCVTKSQAIDNPTLWTVSIIVPDPCVNDPCDHNADCTQENPLSPNFTCACRPGFIGDGFSCIVPDPCLSDPCDINADCVRHSLLNSLFNCTCRLPFEGSGITCFIPDPCVNDPCDRNADCTQENPLSPNFTCACRPGFIGDGFSCIVPDPCLSDPCDINADCVRHSLLNSLFNCTCRLPFEGSGITCFIPDPCLFGPCDIAASCMREGLLSENFTCSCQEPFTGNGLVCSIPDPCVSGPCHLNASCVREGLRSGEFQCECDHGYQGDGLNCTAIEQQSHESSEVIIISVLSISAVIILVILVGAVYGYVKVLSGVVKSVKDSDAKPIL